VTAGRSVAAALGSRQLSVVVLAPAHCLCIVHATWQGYGPFSCWGCLPSGAWHPGEHAASVCMQLSYRTNEEHEGVASQCLAELLGLQARCTEGMNRRADCSSFRPCSNGSNSPPRTASPFGRLGLLLKPRGSPRLQMALRASSATPLSCASRASQS
jgi:hypothetical protein